MEITQKMRDDAKTYPTSNADKIMFCDLVSILEELKPSRSTAGKRKSKKSKIEILFNDSLLKRLDGHSPFPLVRLLAPICDRERPAYSIKEKVLAKLFCEAVGLDLKSEAAMALLKFNNANHVPSGLGHTVGDFPAVLEGILRTRSFHGKELTLGQVNEHLDALSSSPSGVQRKAIIHQVYSQMNHTEIKWFARIVLKDLKIGVKHDKILGYIHKNGPGMFSMCSDLRLVLATLRDPNVEYTYSLTLMQPFEPMLASTAYKYDCTTSMKHGFMVEWKYDGERMLIHKDGDDIKCITRRGNDYTKYYGNILGPMMRKYVHCEKCVLDGEVLPWNNDAKRFGKFGSNQSVAKQQLEGKNNKESWLCFVIFDIVWCEHPDQISLSSNEKHRLPKTRGNLTELDLRTRKEYLHCLISEKENKFYIGKAQFYEGTPQYRASELKKWMNLVVEQCQEGIMVKDISSKYICGATKSKKLGHWIKLKPGKECCVQFLFFGLFLSCSFWLIQIRCFYIANLTPSFYVIYFFFLIFFLIFLIEYFDKLRDNLDFVILGGYYGEGSQQKHVRGRAGQISTFLLGVVADEDDGENDLPRFYTVGKVGTGYTFEGNVVILNGCVWSTTKCFISHTCVFLNLSTFSTCFFFFFLRINTFA